MPRPTRIVGVVALAVLSGACSGGGLSKEEYIAQADEICAAAQESAQNLPQPTDPASAEGFADSLEEITNDYIGELRELEPPEEDAQQIEEFVGQMEQAGLKIVEATRSNSLGADPARAYDEALQLAEEANEHAQGYGFSSCGISEGLAPH
jgi:hypothetical protein